MLLTSRTKRGQISNNTAVEVLIHCSDPMKNDANKLFIVESSESFFSDVIRTTVGCPHLYVFNFTTAYARKISNQATIEATS